MGKNNKRFLVAMIPNDDLSEEIKYMAKLAGYHFSGRIDPHITIMPPINISVEGLLYLRNALRDSVEEFLQEPIAVGPVESFLPKNPAVFLRVRCQYDKDNGQKSCGKVSVEHTCQNCFLYQIASQLSIGELEPPPMRDSYQFIPHITIGHAKNIFDTEKTIKIFRSYSAYGYINSIALLEQDLSSENKSWSIVDEPYFGKKQKVSLGGEFLSIGYEKILSPYDLAAMNRDEKGLPQGFDISGYLDFIYGQAVQYNLHVGESKFVSKPFVITLRNPGSGSLLGAAVTRVREMALHVLFFFVAEAARGLGAGRLLMRQLEKLAHEKECGSITMAIAPGSELIRFLEKFGYKQIGQISIDYLNKIYGTGFINGADDQDIQIMAKII